ncbi:type IV pilin [Halopenitus sp. H-Gu1]|uniref:type IV pilin n=1 Tax=Halopenitus sp. H-Gu1 TaxID=3242697 RepID=UPI00359D93CD
MRAQSETVGVIALLGVVTIFVTMVGVTGIAMIPSEETDRAQTTMVDVGLSSDSVRIVHAGGEPVSANEIVVRIDHDGGTDVYRLDTDGTVIEGRFDPGEVWTLAEVPYGATATVDVHVIHEPTNTVLDRQHTVFGDDGNGDGD